MDLGLERVTRLLEALAPHVDSKEGCKTLEAPHLAFPIIHVAGTNGKGSICAYLSTILHTAGLRVGRYNSPHLITPRDTIQVNNQAISQKDFEWVTNIVQEKNVELNLKATSFEVLTATAFYWFAYGRSTDNNKSGIDNEGKERVDVAIIEVGVGGRLDATNIVPRPLVSVIASIGMDHGALLGNTIEQVAFEKAGIIKPKVPVVIAPQAEGEKVYNVLEKQAMNVGLPADKVYKVKSARWIQPNDVSSDLLSKSTLDNKHEQGKWAITDDGLQILIPLLGDFQLENAATAISAIYAMRANADGYREWIVDQKNPERWEQVFTRDAIRNGIRDTVWPGRLQWIEGELAPKQVGGRMLIDGAHNPAAAIALRSFIDGHINSVRSAKEKGKEAVRVHWIMGFTKGKDIEEMFEILFPANEHCRDTFTAVEFSEPEGMPWISSIPSQEVCERLLAQQKKAYGKVKEREESGGVVVNGFGNDLRAGLEWVGGERNEDDLVVLCGSLYLAADLFRMME